MSDHLFGLVELVFVFVVVIGFGVWQLYSLKRHSRRRDDDDGTPR